MHESKGDAALVSASVFLVAGSTAILTVVLTSDLTPLGRHVYSVLAKADADPAGGGLHPYQVSLGICILLVFFGYLLDLHLWRSHWWPLVKTYAAILGLFFIAAVVLYSNEAPSIPVLLGIGLGLWLVHLLRVGWFPHLPVEQFSYFAGVAYAAVGQACVVVWASWVFTAWMGLHNWDWVEPARPSLSTQNFVRWCSPFLVALVYVLIAVFLRWRSCMHTMDEYVLAELKLICSSLVLLFLFSWLAASIAAGDAGLSQVVLRLSILLSIGATAYLVWTVGPQAILSSCQQNETLSLLIPLLTGDWAKGAFILICSPIIPVCVVVEIIHNFVRRIHTNVGKGAWVTDEAADAVEVMRNWHIGSVLTKGVWIGTIYFVLQVGCGRGVVVILAWVCERSLTFSWPAVVGILYGIGVALFLLPPVPGCPIYMVAGILITKRFESTGGHFLLASLVALVVSMAIKLTAVAMQQKLIGERFSDSICVKKLVAVHTPEMKAIRHILSQPGLRMDKVVVLVCGPDWPTSVLTGVLKLPLLQMLLGTLPVVFLIMPFTLAGSFMVHASTLPDNTEGKRRYEGLSSALIFLSMLNQMGGLMLIFQCTHGTMERFKDEIEKGTWMKDSQEEEVLQDIALSEEKTKIREECTRWSVLPWWVRAALVLGILLMSIMMHIIILPFLKPFRDFSLQDKFSDIEGVEFLINKPGWVAIACFCCSNVCLMIFEAWCGSVMSRSEEEKPLVSAPAVPDRSYSGTSA
mmetsp:Transcript_27911/g.65923  ORF Transcript_27911/g.65923 Transcript_27911/m.65923 type:complete len:748 (-) Transcript_27911:189-2432(-)